MNAHRPSRPVSARLAVGAVVAVATAFAGCDAGRREGMSVATAWPAAEREMIEKAFVRWAVGGPTAGRIQWVPLAPGDDLERLARHRRAPDVILGGPMRVHRRIEARGLVASDGQVAIAMNEAPAPVGRVPDPRRDPAVLADAQSRLTGPGWNAGYAALVRAAAGATLGPTGPPWTEGVSVLGQARDPTAARTFLRFLAETRPASGPTPSASVRNADGLLADLLGSTLVDARPELSAAWEAVERRHFPERAMRWLETPPPWPPASVARILEKEVGAMPMLGTLAGQVAPGPGARAWLVRSWLSPSRTIDAAWLDELAAADDGRLAREPRFRAWLRGEWTAWARQRYRRVARLSEFTGTIGQ